MANDRFLLLAVDSSQEGVWVLLRCCVCAEASGFHFRNESLLGRYPLLCSCGAEAVLDLQRPTVGEFLVRELQEAFTWAPVWERRLFPKLN